MKIDSMILNMREKSIQKEKQKTDLKLYHEDEIRNQRNQENVKEQSKVQTKSHTDKKPHIDEKTHIDERAQVNEKPQFDEKPQSDEKPHIDERAQVNKKPQINTQHQTYTREETSRLFELLEEQIDDIKNRMSKEFRIRQPKEIYESNQVDSDMKSGIFMIDMYRNSLPAEMEEKIKKKSVMEILHAFEISTKDLEQDGAQKQEALKKELKEVKERIKDAISKKKSAIKKMEKNIAKMKEMIAELEAYQQAQSDVIKNEQTKIEHALKFMKRRSSSKKKTKGQKGDEIGESSKS